MLCSTAALSMENYYNQMSNTCLVISYDIQSVRHKTKFGGFTLIILSRFRVTIHGVWIGE
jgi:hypothetical protein